MTNIKCLILNVRAHLESDLENMARKVIDKATDDATLDHTHEPVRWGNSQGLTVLEKQDSMMKQIKQHFEQMTSIQQEVKSLKADVAALKATTESFYAVVVGFLPVFCLISSR